jgi:hypothetical protein
MEKEICNECGRSLKVGSGLFSNRIYDFNDYKTRIFMNKPFPEGSFICFECDEKLNHLIDARN